MNTERAVAATVAGHALESHAVRVPDVDAILRVVRDLTTSDANHRRFPGPSPVSMERADVRRLRPEEYVACEKTDGCRFLLACLRHRGLNLAVLVDRKMSVHLLPLRHVPDALFEGTVMDGELAWDKGPGGPGGFAFLIFDAMAVAGVPVGHATLPDRMRAAAAGLHAYRPAADDPARLELKTFVPVADVAERLRTAVERFDVDGVVLTPVADPVRVGRAPRVFKLKTHHTVDFLVGDDRGLYAFAGGGGAHHVKVGRIAGGDDADVRSGDVVECTHAARGDPTCDLWFVVGKRTDKTTANDLLTLDKTMLNMRENLTVDDLVTTVTAGTPGTTASSRPSG